MMLDKHMYLLFFFGGGALETHAMHRPGLMEHDSEFACTKDWRLYSHHEFVSWHFVSVRARFPLSSDVWVAGTQRARRCCANLGRVC